MKRENLTNMIYRETEYNGSRVKILDKNYIRINHNQHNYIVPRTNDAYATIQSFGIRLDFETLGYFCNEKDGVIWIEENKEKNLIIECSTDSDISQLSCKDVTLTIFRVGNDKAIMQYSLKKEYEKYYFVSSNDCETLPDAGKYIAIVSGLQHRYCRYNHSNHYMVIPFTVTKSDTPHIDIYKACYTLNDTLITGSTTPLDIRLWHNSTSDDDVILSAQCFDSELTPVAHSNIAIAAHKRGDYSDITITPQLFWIENEQYTIVINNQQKALATLTFTMTNNAKCHICRGVDIDNIYRNIIQIHPNDHSLMQLVTGMSTMRNEIALRLGDIHKIDLLNHKIAGLKLNRSHHAIIMKNGEYEKSPTLNCAYALSQLLYNESTEILNCESLCKEDSLRKLYSDENVCVWTHIEPLCENRNTALHYIQSYIDEEKHIILYDNPKAVEKFLTHYPELRDLFNTDYIFHRSKATAKEIAYLFYRKIKSSKRLLCDALLTQHIYNTLVQKEAQNENLQCYNHNTIEHFLTNSVTTRLHKRILSIPEDKAIMMGSRVMNLQPEDIDFSYFSTTSSIQDCLGELNDMIGLHAIKKEIITLATQLQFNRHRAQLGLPLPSTGCHHMIFTGNPGTGKTTVAKMMGKIFHQLGLLSNGDVIVTERSKILGQYIGETENKVKELIQEATGKVLFIDEAYTLCSNEEDGKDFGRHAIEALLTTLADEHADILVIMAGYKYEMERMMNINTGLKGRFPHQWHFDDYNCEELMQIAYHTLQKECFTLTVDADNRLRNAITAQLLSHNKDFSNARWIKQQITHSILPAMAQRVMQQATSDSLSLYTTIEACDIVTTDNTPLPYENKTRNRIGFGIEYRNKVA